MFQENKAATVTTKVPNNILFNILHPKLNAQMQSAIKTAHQLATGDTFNNAINDLKGAKSSIITMQENVETNNATKDAENTLNSIISAVNKIVKLATSRGVNPNTCTDQTMDKLLRVGMDFGVGVAACPVTEAKKIITMINNDIAYITDLFNLTRNTQRALNSCMGVKKLANQVTCVSNYLGTTSTKILNVPVTVISMVSAGYASSSNYPVNVAVCATNSSFASLGNANLLAVDITKCITKKVLPSN